MAICQVHLVRVVTDENYKPDEIGDLAIKVGELTTPETTLNFTPPVKPLQNGLLQQYQSL